MNRHRAEDLDRARLTFGIDRTIDRAAAPLSDEFLQFKSGDFRQAHAGATGRKNEIRRSFRMGILTQTELDL
jgi:hypothetical protein